MFKSNDTTLPSVVTYFLNSGRWLLRVHTRVYLQFVRISKFSQISYLKAKQTQGNEK